MRHNLHLGVTGLQQSGKTVFLTSLIYQLAELGSNGLPHLDRKGVTFRAARMDNPRTGVSEIFPYTRFLNRLRQELPLWPAPTIRESGCVLRFYYENPGAKGRLDSLKQWVGRGKSYGTIVLHLHDYPGEYLLDVGLTKKTYRAVYHDILEFSARVLVTYACSNPKWADGPDYF